MKLSNIKIDNVRNISSQKLHFSNQVNIFLGSNGHGKTNILESIYLISLTKSFRTNKLDNIIRFNESFFIIEGLLEKDNYQYLINYYYQKNKSKDIKINNSSSSKYSDIIGLLNVVLFIPEDLFLLKGSPMIRRKQIDIELSKIYPKYFINLSYYNKILKDRNLCLKSSFVDSLMIDSYDEQLVKYGSVIVEYRNMFISKIEALINNFYQLLSGQETKINIIYKTNINKNDSYLTSLKESFNKDCLLNQTSIGIHRDDFVFFINDKDVSVYASQGEQRSIILAFKLSIVEYIYEVTKDYPLLLLDDVMSELDDVRQDNLIRYLNDNVQTFITTTSLEVLNDEIKNKAKVFSVYKGIVKEDFNE